MPKQTAISKVNEQYLKDRENGYTREYSNTENTARQMLEEYEREQEEQRRKTAEERYQRQNAQLQSRQNAEFADWIKGMSPSALADDAQQRRLDTAQGIYTTEADTKHLGSGRSFGAEETTAPKTASQKKRREDTAYQKYLAQYDGVSNQTLFTNADYMQNSARAAQMQRDQMASELAANPGLIFNQDFTQGMSAATAQADAKAQAASRLTDEYNKVTRLRSRQKERETYGSLNQNADYVKLSQGNAETAERANNSLSPKMIRYYNIYNREKVRNGATTGAPAEAYVTDDEAGKYFYLWEKQGAEAAEAYYNTYVKSRAQERRTSAERGNVQALAASSPIMGAAMSAASIPLQATGIIGMIDLTVQNAERRLGINTDKPINYNTAWQAPSGQASAIRESVANKIQTDVTKNLIESGHSEKNANLWGTAASFLYQTGMSMADSGVQALLVRVGLPQEAMLTLMAGGAGMNAIREAKQRGVSDGEALAYGYAAAFAEGIFEHVSLENLMNAKTPATIRQGVAEVLKQALAEGSEEFSTTYANTLTDMLINGGQSEISQKVLGYMADGLSNKEAYKAAAINWLKGAGMDFLGGALSGGAMGGMNVGVNLGMNVKENFQAGLVQEDLRNIGRAQQAELAARQAYQAAQERTTPPLPQQVAQEQQERVTTPPLPQSAQRAAETQQNNSLRILTEDNARTGDVTAALRDVNPGIVEAMSEDTTIRDAVNAVNAEVQKGTISAEAGSEFLDMMWQAGSDNESRQGFLRSIYDTGTGELRPQALNAARRIDTRNAGQTLRLSDNAPAAQQAPLTVGPTNDYVNANRQEVNNGQKQAEASAASEFRLRARENAAGRQALGGSEWTTGVARLLEAARNTRTNRNLQQRANAAARLQDQAEARRLVKQSGQDLGIEDASDAKTVTVLDNDMLGKEWEQMVSYYASKGVKLQAMIGQIETKDLRANGKPVTVRAWVSGDGKNIIVQADHPTLSWQQLLAHEELHRRIKENSGFKKAAQDALLADKSLKPYLSQIIDRYTEAYRAVKPSITDDEVIEELLADYRAGFDMLDPLGTLAGVRKATKAAARDIRALERKGVAQAENNAEEQSRGSASTEIEAPYNRTALLTEDTVDRWLKDYAAKSSPKYAQAYVTRMSPEQFLKLTTSRTGRLTISSQTGPMDAEQLIKSTQDQPLQLIIRDGEVVGHEGRHRVTALSRANVQSIPVLVFDSSNKNSKTDVPEMVLQGQDFGSSRSYDRVTLENMIPLSYENRERIVQEYGKQDAFERSAEKVGLRQTMKFSREIRPDVIDRLDKQLRDGDYVIVYHSMYQDKDGNLYSPMAGKKKVGNKWVMTDPYDLNAWYKSDIPENIADLIENGSVKLKDNGKWSFTLKKPDAKTGDVPAALNPWNHASTDALNDQFTSAYERENDEGELVTVECVIPLSEVDPSVAVDPVTGKVETKPYEEKGMVTDREVVAKPDSQNRRLKLPTTIPAGTTIEAKDSVGLKMWKAGPVHGQISGKRPVYLSRWIRNTRVLSTEETAKMIAKTLKDEGFNGTIPGNVVGLKLRQALEEEGVKFGKPQSSVSKGYYSYMADKGYTRKQAEGAKIGGKASTEIETAINQSMTMEQAQKMIQRAFVLGEIKEWFDGEYKNGDEWLQGEGAEAVALIVDNEESLQHLYLDKIPGVINGDFYAEDIIEAYKNGTLTGKEKKQAEKADLSGSKTVADSRFYAPRQIENAKELLDTASKRMTKSNEKEVIAARAAILLYAHNKGAAETLGLTDAELNKRLRSWSNYSAKAREASQRINAGVTESNRWTGIENSSYAMKATVTQDEVANVVGKIEGDGDGYQNKYIARTVLALDTHIDWSWLNFKFDTPAGVNAHKSANESRCNGYYTSSNRQIHVKRDAPNTVAHEMGHALDDQWGREVGVGGFLSQSSRNSARISDEVRPWFDRFHEFCDTLADSSDIRSSYSGDIKETFARFIDRFVGWTEMLATGYTPQDRGWYNDKFTTAQFVQFARLLQEKAALDANGATRNQVVSDGAGKASTEIDADYMAAVERGDMETAQRMVDEAAKAAGYTIRGYHGTQASFTIFNLVKTSAINRMGRGFYFSDSLSEAEDYSGRSSTPSADLLNKIEQETNERYDEQYGDSDFDYSESIEKWNEIYDQVSDEFAKNGKIISANIKMSKPAYYRRATDGIYAYAFYDKDGKNLGVSMMDTIDAAQELVKRGYDGIVDETVGKVFDSKANAHYTVFSPEQVKSADPITYDNDGKIIPLSERFNPADMDIRYSIEIDPEVAAQFSPEAIARRQSNRTKGTVGKKKVSRVRSNTYEYSGLFNAAEADMIEANEQNYTYDVTKETTSMNNARKRLADDFDGEVANLGSKNDQWSGEDLDTAMGILHRYRTEGRATGDYGDFWRWSKVIQEKGTIGGKFIQAFAKYTRTGTGAAMKGAKDIHDRFKLNPVQQKQVDAAKKKLMDGIDSDMSGAAQDAMKQAKGQKEPSKKQDGKVDKKKLDAEVQRRKDAERLVREISKLFEKQQNHGEPAENWLNLTGEELARKIAGRFSEPKQRTKTTMQTILSDLVGFAEEHALPDRKKAEGTKRTAIDIITDYLNNRDAYGTAWAAAQSYLRAAYTDDQEKLDALNSFLTATIAYNAEGTDRTMLDAILQSADVLGISEKRILELTSAGATASTIDRIGDELVSQVKERMGADYDESFTQQLKDAVRRHITGIALQESAEDQRLRLGGMTTDAARQLELNLQKLLTQSRGDKNKASQSVADYLIRELGIPSSDAAIAAERITGAFMDELASRADRRLQQMFAEKKPRTQEQRDKLLDLIRLGGLTNSNVEDAVVDALGIGGMSRERQRELVGAMAQFGETLDAMEADDLDGLKNLIRAQAAVRNTPLSRQAEKALAGETDAEYLREFALAQLDAIAGDFAEMSPGAKISTFQTISHLLNMRTALRNLTSNQVFDLVDSAANNLATIPDMVIGAFTGKRTVGTNKSWLSEMKRAGAKQGAARNALEVRLDVSPEDRQKSKYGTAGRRTNSMAASNAFGRILSHLEEVMGYELNTTDEFHKGSVRGETLESLARFVERGDITQEQANAWAEEEALYRSFQDDTLVGNIMGELKTLLNVIGFGDSGKTNSRGRTIHDFGLGDLVVKYTQVPGALIHRGIEYSPLGYAKMLYDLAIAKDSLVRTQRRGEDVTNAQRKLALDIGRATTGSGLITLFAVLAKAGLLRRDDDDKDKNAKAMHAAQGLSGTQLNLTALKRWIEGGGLSLTDGDVLADIGFLEPLDSLMTIATLMANDDDLKLTDIGVKSLDGVWKAISNTSAMQTISNIISTVQYHDEENDLPLYFQIPIEIASDSVSGFIPSPVRQLAQATDTTYRDQYRSKNLNDQIRARVANSIPGLRQTLAPKITPLGEDRKYQKPLLNYLNATLNPGNINVYQGSGVVDELNRVYGETDDAKIWPERNAPYSFTANDEKWTLTPDERTQYQRTRGQTTANAMDAVMGTDWYKSMGATDQAEVLNWIGNFSNFVAKKEMLESRGQEYGSTTYNKYYEAWQGGTPIEEVVADKYGKLVKAAEETATAETIIAEAKIPEASKAEAETMSDEAKRYYAGFLKGGVSDETARNLATSMEGSEASGHEQWRMVYDAAGNEGEKAVTSVMTDDMKRNWDLAKGVGVSMDDYIKVREGFKDLNGNGKQTQDEWNATLDSYTFSTNEAKDKSIKGTLWQILTGSGSTKNNPYDKEAGQKVIDAKSGGGSGSGSYAPAKIPTLRIPAAPTVSKPSSGLRIRAAAPAAQAPRSGLRIRAQ